MPTFSELYVEVSNNVIAVGGTTQFTVYAIFSNSTFTNITNQITYLNLINTNTISASGLYSGNHSGNDTVILYSQQYNATITQPILVTSGTAVSVVVTPANHTIAEYTRLQYKALCTFSDSSVYDVTNFSTWGNVLSNQIGYYTGTYEAVGISYPPPNYTATFAPAQNGSDTITATFNGVAGSTGLTVTHVPINNNTVNLVNSASFTTTLITNNLTSNPITFSWSGTVGNLLLVFPISTSYQSTNLTVNTGWQLFGNLFWSHFIQTGETTFTPAINPSPGLNPWSIIVVELSGVDPNFSPGNGIGYDNAETGAGSGFTNAGNLYAYPNEGMSSINPTLDGSLSIFSIFFQSPLTSPYSSSATLETFLPSPTSSNYFLSESNGFTLLQQIVGGTLTNTTNPEIQNYQYLGLTYKKLAFASNTSPVFSYSPTYSYGSTYVTPNTVTFNPPYTIPYIPQVIDANLTDILTFSTSLSAHIGHGSSTKNVNLTDNLHNISDNVVSTVISNLDFVTPCTYCIQGFILPDTNIPFEKVLVVINDETIAKNFKQTINYTPSNQ